MWLRAGDGLIGGHTGGVTESSEDLGRFLSEGTLGRTARLLSIPLGAAGRATVGAGRRLLGESAEQVEADLSRAAADQLFAVLGELKGGAMTFGQVLSMMEAMLPEEIAGPFRDRLAQLQDSAPPMPTSRVHAVLRAELGTDWRSHFAEFEPRPAAAASIGQVHRARLAGSGEPVAVKVQYPGADAALHSDLKQIQRLASAASPVTGGLDVVALTREVAARIAEEVDYLHEAAAQNQMAEAIQGHPRFVVPRARMVTSRVLVSDWVDGVKLGRLADAPREARNAAALDYVTFLFAGPALGGLLHGDPHPGNFLVTADGRLGVLDFGLTAEFPDGLPRPMGELIRRAVAGDAAGMLAGLSQQGFIAGEVEASELLDYLNPFVEPASVEEFHFDREWTRSQFSRVQRSMGADQLPLKLNIPPEYGLIYRVWLGGIAVLAQLDVTADFAAVLRRYLPGFAD